MSFKNDTDLYRVIGSNIKRYRVQEKLTQVQLAGGTGVSHFDRPGGYYDITSRARQAG